MSCPFYGKHAAVEVNAIVGQGGNQCALIIDSYAPCVMEQRGLAVDAYDCDLLQVASRLRASLARQGMLES